MNINIKKKSVFFSTKFQTKCEEKRSHSGIYKELRDAHTKINQKNKKKTLVNKSFQNVSFSYIYSELSRIRKKKNRKNLKKKQNN